MTIVYHCGGGGRCAGMYTQQEVIIAQHSDAVGMYRRGRCTTILFTVVVVVVEAGLKSEARVRAGIRVHM